SAARRPRAAAPRTWPAACAWCSPGRSISCCLSLSIARALTLAASAGCSTAARRTGTHASHHRLETAHCGFRLEHDGERLLSLQIVDTDGVCGRVDRRDSSAGDLESS